MRVNTVLRTLLLALAVSLLAGCGQKGDLFRPGKPQQSAVHARNASGS
jgi:predicted small lipoprotein YifL